MKTHSFRAGLLCGLLFCVAGGLSLRAADANTLYREALAAYEAQNWAVAAQKFGQVYQQTRNPRAQYYLKNAQLKLAQGQPAQSLERKLSQVIIPGIQFEGTDVPTALEFLRTKINEVSKGKVQPNFLYKRDPNNPALPTVTLQLTHPLPATEVIRYIGETTGTRFKYETYAVVGSPDRLAVPAPAP